MDRTTRIWVAAILAVILVPLSYSLLEGQGEPSAGGERVAAAAAEPRRQNVTLGAPAAVEEALPGPNALGATSRPSRVREGSRAGVGATTTNQTYSMNGVADVISFDRYSCIDTRSRCWTHVHRVGTDGSDDRQLAEGAASSWSRDGKRVAFGTQHGRGSLQLMNADGSDRVELTVNGGYPTWSPDGTKLAFNWNCDSEHRDAGCYEYPESTGGCGAICGIGVVGVDGSAPQRLGTGIWPDWGPDERIVFTDGKPTEPCQYGNSYWHEEGVLTSGGSQARLPSCALPLWVMEADGSGRTALPIEKATAPKWSPSGKKIAYHVETEGAFISNADGTAIVKVAPAGYMDPSWSPDGEKLAFTRKTPGGSGWSIFVRAIDGSGEQQITYGPRDTHPSFSPTSGR